MISFDALLSCDAFHNSLNNQSGFASLFIPVIFLSLPHGTEA
jgi:hypothetical protein